MHKIAIPEFTEESVANKEKTPKYLSTKQSSELQGSKGKFEAFHMKWSGNNAYPYSCCGVKTDLEEIL